MPILVFGSLFGCQGKQDKATPQSVAGLSEVSSAAECSVEVSLLPDAAGTSAYESDKYKIYVKQGAQWVESATYKKKRPWAAHSNNGKLFNIGESPSVSWTTIGTNNSEIEVKVVRLFDSKSSFDIYPSRYGINPQRVTDKGKNFVSFKARKHEKIWVDFKDKYNTVFVFVSASKPAVPPNATYFGKGVHNVGLNYVPPSEVIYLDNGAWLNGTIGLPLGKSVRLIGPGVISGEDFRWEDIHSWQWEHTQPYFLVHSIAWEGEKKQWKIAEVQGDVEINGPTLVQGPMYSIRVHASGNVKVRDVHIISFWTYNTDGFGVKAGLNKTASIEDSFALVNDDALYLNDNSNNFLI